MKQPGDRAMGKIVAQVFTFDSISNPDRMYETLVYEDSSLSCNCKGWIFNKKCRHISEVTGMLIRPQRLERIKRNEAEKLYPAILAKVERSITQKAAPIQTYILQRAKRKFQLEED